MQSPVNKAKSLRLDCTCTGACPASKPPIAGVYRGKLPYVSYVATCKGKACSVGVTNLAINAKNIVTQVEVCLQ